MMAFVLGSNLPPKDQATQVETEYLPVPSNPIERVYSVGGVDPAVDMMDGGAADQADDLVTFESLPQDEKSAVLMMLQFTDKQLMPLALQASTLLGHTRESRLAREARLHVVHKLRMKGYTLAAISLKLGIGPRRVSELVKTLDTRIKQQISKIDFGLYAGNQIADYQALKHLAMTIVGDESHPMTSRMASFAMALRSMKDEHVFLQRCGIFRQFQTGDDLIKRLQTEADGSEGATVSLTDVAQAFKKHAALMAHRDAGVNIEDAVLIDEEDGLWVADELPLSNSLGEDGEITE